MVNITDFLISSFEIEMIEHRRIVFIIILLFPYLTGCYMLLGECLFNLLCLYLQKVKDSWRVVNHRDIIPTVPRLMGYCHVAQPVYLAPGDLRNALVGNLFFSFILEFNSLLRISTIMSLHLISLSCLDYQLIYKPSELKILVRLVFAEIMNVL